MDKLELAPTSTNSSEKGAWDALDLPAALRLHARLYTERFGTTDHLAKFDTVLTSEQVARVESLMDVPMHMLPMWDDQTDREILACQRLKRDLEHAPLYKTRAAQGWAYWARLFTSQVNTLRR